MKVLVSADKFKLERIKENKRIDVFIAVCVILLLTVTLGSKLKESATGRSVWGTFGGGYANPNKEDGAGLISLPMNPQDDDGVFPNGVLDNINVKLLGLSLHEKAYYHLILTLGLGGYIDQGIKGYSIDYGDDHFTCFQFSYDWRKSSAYNAKKLHQFILEKKKYIQKAYFKRFGIKKKDIKFDIVSHSMGGADEILFKIWRSADR